MRPDRKYEMDRQCDNLMNRRRVECVECGKKIDPEEAPVCKDCKRELWEKDNAKLRACAALADRQAVKMP